MERTKHQILRALKKKPMSFWELIRYQDSTLSEVTRTIGRMLAEHEIGFAPKTRKFSLHELTDVLPKGNGLCPTCQGKGATLDTRFEETLETFLKVITDRPPPIFEYNQGLIEPRDLALKSAFMYDRGDLEGCSVLLIGDDDLFCLFLGLLGLPSNLTVLEIDDRFIRYINQKARTYSLSISARQYDVNTHLPRDLQGAFDAFITEPPEGLKGMLLFLRRGIDSLALGGSGYFGLTTLESSLPKWLAAEKFLVERGMVITDILRNFSLYPEAGDPIDDYDKFPISQEFPVDPGSPDVDYFRSSLIRVEKTTPTTTEGQEAFYTDEETWVTVNPEERG